MRDYLKFSLNTIYTQNNLDLSGYLKSKIVMYTKYRYTKKNLITVASTKKSAYEKKTLIGTSFIHYC